MDKERKEINILNNINGYPLDDYQSRVVLSEEQNTLVTAGAGSGKSLTIIGKIVYLIEIKKIKPEEILCISFTNDATINLKNNIKKNYNYEIDIYTFHKLALLILNLNKIEYTISPDELLDNIINEYFDTIKTNKHYNKIKKYLLKNNKETEKVKKTIKTFINLFTSENYKPDYFNYILKRIKYTLNYKEYQENKYIILLIVNIYYIYQQQKKENNAIDFNDMINKSIEILKSNKLNKNWKYIIIDEYQDTSLTKFNLINEIIKQTNAKLLVVGDDFQSIYRFTGCNLNIFLEFNKYFTYSKTFQIVNTYRNPQELINVAGDFIMKNKKQQKKILKSSKHLEKPIKIFISDNKIDSLKYLLKEISYQQCKEIMVLGRNNNDIKQYIDENYTVNNDIYTYQNISFRYLTMHKSKGLESNIVIIINLYDNNYSIPSKIKNEKIIKYVNNNKDIYPYEEERRLFYVALTRTKTEVYLIIPSKKESIFITELKKYKNYIEYIKK